MDRETPDDALLRGTELFGALDEGLRAECARRFRRQTFPAGQTIFLAGDPGHHAYLVSQGLVRISLSNAAGREFNVHIAQPGDLVGEIAILDGGPRTAHAVTLTDVTAYVLTADDFARLMDAHPQLARSVIALLCRRMRNTLGKLEDVTLYRVEVRLARFILHAMPGDDLPAGEQTGGGDMAGRKQELRLDYSQSELARLIGTTRSKLNVSLRLLEADGVLKRTGRTLVCDRMAITRLAHLS